MAPVTCTTVPLPITAPATEIVPSAATVTLTDFTVELVVPIVKVKSRGLVEPSATALVVATFNWH